MGNRYHELSSEALALFLNRRYRDAVAKFEEALEIPSDAPDRVAVEWCAGVTYTHFTQSGIPLQQLVREPHFIRSIELMEGAIRRDLSQGGRYFHDPANWRRTTQLDIAYASVADVLEEEQAHEAALEYLLERESVIHAGAMLESAARIGTYYSRAGNAAKAIEWFRRAAEMPPISVDSHESQTRSYATQELNRLTKKSGCFIATAAYGSPSATQVEALREFRDECLRRAWVGRVFVRVYYLLSPPLARFIERATYRRRLARVLISALVRMLAKCRRTKPRPEPRTA